MSIVLVEEVKKAVSRSAVSGSLIKKYFYGRAPQDSPYPYVVFYLISDIYFGNDTGTKYSDVKVQFNIFDNNNDYGKRTDDILGEILTYYDKAKDVLQVSGSTMINAKRDFIIPPFVGEEKNWQATVQYNLHLQNI